MSDTNKNSKWLLVAIVVMMVLHQDFWLWENETLLFGFLPIGLAYHIGFSICASLLFFIAIKFCWPTDLEE